MSDGLSIQHVNVMVDDLAIADAFHTEVLGLERAPTPDLGFPAQFYRVGEHQQLHVNQLADVHPQRSHFCLRLDDFNGVFARAREHDLIELSWAADQPVDDAIFELDVVDASSNEHYRSS